ncbi:hypothetical protein [Vibrio sp. TBV020]|uniref:hypothetical protein n=1 Tax=Vibrio sp. TBV020 TaxID=3137398 RepID=UPI0038CD7A81
MTINEFKQSDTYQCLIVAMQLFRSIGSVAYKLSKVLVKALLWVAIKSYRYVAK